MSNIRRKQIITGVLTMTIACVGIIIAMILSKKYILSYTGVKEAQFLVTCFLLIIVLIGGLIIAKAMIKKFQAIGIDDNDDLIKKQLGDLANYTSTGDFKDYQYLKHNPTFKMESAVEVDINHIIRNQFDGLSYTTAYVQPIIRVRSKKDGKTKSSYTPYITVCNITCENAVPDDIRFYIASQKLVTELNMIDEDTINIGDDYIKRRLLYRKNKDYVILSNDNEVNESTINELILRLEAFDKKYDFKTTLFINDGRISLSINDFHYFRFNDDFRVDVRHRMLEDLKIIKEAISKLDTGITNIRSDY